MTLTEFLLARIAEDEAVAQAVAKAPSWLWPPMLDDRDIGGPGTESNRGYFATQAHVERHHPARVLAECEAKRRIVGLHQATPVLEHWEFDCACGFADHRLSECFCGAKLYDEGECERTYGPCPTLAALAAVYANHPEYREEWKP